jgi:hypothetical protein
MQSPNISATALLALSLAGWSVFARAQSASQQNPPASGQSAPPASPTPAPGSPTKDKAKQGTTPVANADQSALSEPPQAPAKKPAADDNPFPEDVSQKAAAAAKAAATPDAPIPTSADKQAQGSSSLDNTDKLGLDDPNRKLLKLESPDGTTDVYDPKRATEDVRVGKFYLQTGFNKGAYERFKDATTFDHENAEAIFWLAEAARKLNLAKEAEQNYQLYLAAVPDGPSAKAAKKALGELGSSSKP